MVETIVNNPEPREGSGAGVVLGVILALILIVLFLVYGLPVLRGGGEEKRGGVDLPNEVNVNVEGGIEGGSGQGQ